MSSRIRALEDALAILQATVSSERHPLLSDELIKIKFGAEALKSEHQGSSGGPGGNGPTSSSASHDGVGDAVVKTEEQENIDALGTLTLDDKSGEVKYFGRSAGSETLLMASEEWAAPSAEDGETYDDAADDHPFEYPFSVNPYYGTHASSSATSFNPSAASSPDPSSPPAYPTQTHGHSGSTPTSTHSSSSANNPSTPTGTPQGTLPPLSRLANLFPFTSPIPPSIWKSGGAGLSAATMRKLHERQNLLDLLYAYLPPKTRADELSESYLLHATYFFRPIKRDELFGETSNLPGMPLPKEHHDPTLPHSSQDDAGSSASTPNASSRGFLSQVYESASKRQMRQLQAIYSDAGSPGSSNGDTNEESTPVSPVVSQAATPLTAFAMPSGMASSASFSSGGASSTQSAGQNANTAKGGPSIDSDPDPAAPHALATIFFILALGALLDIKNPPYGAEAERYYILGKAALSLRTVFDFPSIRSVQAVGLMATYHSLAGKKYSRDSAWGLMSLAAKLSQSLGLHRDSARWKFDATTVQRRRSLFWEIFASDVSHSLALGRPPAIHLSYVDCEFPIDEEATLSDAQEIQYGFWRMKHTFARDIFNAVAETTLTAKSPSYSTVLDLDRKVRELSFPAAFKPYVSKEDGEEEYYSSSLSLRGFYASQHRTVTMLYLHRSFFAQAMLDHPNNPLLSPFAPSFLTAYRCASIIIKATAHQFDRCAEMAMRVWFLLYHTFSAAVIVGTVVTHSPTSNMASSALLDLALAVDLFEKASTKSRRARIALDVLKKLKDKAVRSWTQYSTSQPSQTGPGASSTQSSPLSMFGSPTSSFKSPKSDGSDDDGGDELAIFGGQKKVLTRKHRHTSSVNVTTGSKNSPQQASTSNSPSPPQVQATGTPSPPTLHSEPTISLTGQQQQPPNVHPSLMEYLGQTNLFGLENMGNVAGNTHPNPFSGVNASMSMGGDPHLQVFLQEC
ncbi:hypothetical protein ONZ45_g18167 [Pleurotus djamor]|nr:hypothetical protein ONZ45_g18167 [Pleurotus djamor]